MEYLRPGIIGNRRILSESVSRLRELRRAEIRRRVLESGDLEFFATEILGYRVEDFHRRIVEVEDRVGPGGEMIILGPRGGGKSTIGDIARAIFEIVRDPNIRILIGSKTQIQAEVFLREIKLHFSDNPKLRDNFGDFVNPAKWDVREILALGRTRVAKESTVTAIGAGGPIVSRHYDLIILDDILDDKTVKTETARDDLKRWYYKTLLPCLEPEGRIFVIGTRYHPLDLYGHLLKNEFKGSVCRIRSLEPSPDSVLERDGDPLLECKSFWPDKFPVAFLLRRRRQMGSPIFDAQYQNEVEKLKGSIFLEDWFKEYDLPPDFEACIITMGGDPAGTKRDKANTDEAEGDYWTILVGGRPIVGEELGPDFYIFDIYRGRPTKDGYLEELGSRNGRFHPVRLGLESTSAQEYLAQDCEKAGLPLQRIERSIDKVARAYWLQPFIENGQVKFPSRIACELLGLDYELVEALRNELILFPNEKKDLFDSLQTAVSVAFGLGAGGGDVNIRGSILNDEDLSLEVLDEREVA